tara:strand:- start:1117 stop:2244 length:1128 start_codon:yes stop_codon:yes gene_type:complete
MSSIIEELEDRLCILTKRKFCVLTSRATAALFLAFSSLQRKTGFIAFPAILCPSPIFAAICAGYQPIYCDIDPETGNMAPDALETLLSSNQEIVAAVPTHLYGQPAEMKQICELATAYNVDIIEDGAQALGATTKDGTPIGNFGISSILSFGHTKLVDVGYGGALVTDHAEYADVVRAAQNRLPFTNPKNTRALASAYRKEYYRILSETQVNPDACTQLQSFPRRFAKLFMARFNPLHAQAMMDGIDGLQETLCDRRYKAALYDRLLDKKQIIKLRWDEGAAPWRFNVRLPEDCQATITTKLREAGFDASNWYPSLHRLFRPTHQPEAADLHHAVRHEESIVNLWLDGKTSAPRVKACATELNRLLAKQMNFASD